MQPTTLHLTVLVAALLVLSTAEAPQSAPDKHGAKAKKPPLPRPSGKAPKVPPVGKPGAAADEDGPAPVLLGLQPNCGPRDGGTRVELNVLGLNRSMPLRASLRGLRNKGEDRMMEPIFVPVEHFGDDGLAFVVPNLTLTAGLGAGLLVSLTSPLHRSKARQSKILAGPLFFRLLEPLEQLAPAWVSPCCDLKLSGGQVLMLTGAEDAAPSHHAIVRFRGQEHQVDVDGQLVENEWGVAEVADGAPKRAWHIYAVTPPWPQAEESISLEVSWNHQQFSPFRSPLRFREERSFFGDVVQSISEEHLRDGKAEAEKLSAEINIEAGGGTAKDGAVKMTVVENSGGATGQGADMSEALLMDKKGDTFILARSNDLTHLAEDLRLVHDLFILTCAATVGGSLVTRAGAPSIIGYLLAGMVVGPGCLDKVVELVQIESMGELGVCLLLFCIGLELSVQEMRSNMRAALAGVLSMALLCGSIAFLAKYLTQTPLYEALCIGVFASLASTPVSLRAVPKASDGAPLEWNGEKRQLMAILVTQDIILAGLLAAMPVLFRPAKAAAAEKLPPQLRSEEEDPPPRHIRLSADPGQLPQMVLLVCALCAMPCVLCLSFRLRRQACMRRVLDGRRRLRAELLKLDAESFTLMVLAYAFALAWFTDSLGLSVELGAFLGGLALTSFSRAVGERTEHLVGSIKDTFLAWFFASIGLVVNPRFLLDNLRAILSVVMFIFVLKLVTGFLPLWLLARRGEQHPALSALRTSWVLAHISEFGFVLASKGTGWKVLSRHGYLLLVGANAISLCLAPWLFRLRECLLPMDWPAASRPGSRAPSASDVCAFAAPSPANVAAAQCDGATGSTATPRSTNAATGMPEAVRLGRGCSDEDEDSPEASPDLRLLI